jgi:hypothetical protein
LSTSTYPAHIALLTSYHPRAGYGSVALEAEEADDPGLAVEPTIQTRTVVTRRPGDYATADAPRSTFRSGGSSAVMSSGSLVNATSSMSIRAGDH